MAAHPSGCGYRRIDVRRTSSVRARAHRRQPPYGQRVSEGPFDSRNLLSSLGEAVVATDLAGRVRYWSAAAERLYGWSAAEVMGRPATAFLVPAMTQGIADAIRAALLAGATWSGEFTLYRKDGTTFPALVTDAGVRDEDGKLVGIVGVATDLGSALESLLAQSSDA